jgi:hypothetical protein
MTTTARVAVLDGPRLVFPYDRPVTAEEWNAITWPPCPVCGVELLVGRVDMTSIQQRIAHYLPGRMACPDEHDWTSGPADECE